MNKFSDRFDEKSYENGSSCLMALFDTKVIDEIQIPMKLLSRIINLGQAYNLHYTSLVDVFGHIFFVKEHCESFLDELKFLKEVTNEQLLHKHLDNIVRLTEDCTNRNNCKLLVNGTIKLN